MTGDSEDIGLNIGKFYDMIYSSSPTFRRIFNKFLVQAAKRLEVNVWRIRIQSRRDVALLILQQKLFI